MSVIPAFTGSNTGIFPGFFLLLLIFYNTFKAGFLKKGIAIIFSHAMQYL